jgi:hypothetical protein
MRATTSREVGAFCCWQFYNKLQQQSEGVILDFDAFEYYDEDWHDAKAPELTGISHRD